ncbi:BlaI/MecI/CopY family transcriptional regulator [Kitasatospora sp. RB6PN24]|uniref:BlaI/MecI/CopY family transcriptional regulator n=1 Tax=Kitasatospora humi TaxID=2893891 RepID=UPI001E50DF68|nr:BlaI/MecI/CopY family transcriptional regulator [Kitasatospora humi]MCC9311002.1 BlaI/MecI/CopY family transcriptional regulator [Kitasatospora humi]
MTSVNGVEQSNGRRSAGQLENNVLAVLWAADGELTAVQINERLPGGLAVTTVLTILSRLIAKRQVQRHRQGRSYVFAPVRDEAAYTADQMFSLLDRGSDRQAVLARFVSGLSEEDERLMKDLLQDREGR